MMKQPQKLPSHDHRNTPVRHICQKLPRAHPVLEKEINMHSKWTKEVKDQKHKTAKLKKIFFVTNIIQMFALLLSFLHSYVLTKISSKNYSIFTKWQNYRVSKVLSDCAIAIITVYNSVILCYGVTSWHKVSTM